MWQKVSQSWERIWTLSRLPCISQVSALLEKPISNYFKPKKKISWLTKPNFQKTGVKLALETARTRNWKPGQNSYLNFWQFQAHIQALRCSSFSFSICITGILTFLSTSQHYYRDQVRKYMNRGTMHIVWDKHLFWKCKFIPVRWVYYGTIWAYRRFLMGNFCLWEKLG